MLKKILIWGSVFLLFPLLFAILFYLLYGNKSEYREQSPEIGKKINENIQALLPSKEKERYDISTLSGANLKVPLFDKTIIKLQETMSFNSEGKDYRIVPSFPTLLEANTILLPIEVIKVDDDRHFNFITAYTKIEAGWKQGQSVFLGNTLTYNQINFGSGILHTDFDIPVVGNTKKIENVQKYFKVERGQISPYYPSIENGAIKDLSIIRGTWYWIKTEGPNAQQPKDTKLFSLSLIAEGTFSATTDCNSAMGKFFMKGENIGMSDIATTRMACGESSQEQVFLNYLTSAKKYDFKDGKFMISTDENIQLVFEKTEEK